MAVMYSCCRRAALISSPLPVLDLLTPRFIQFRLAPRQARAFPTNMKLFHSTVPNHSAADGAPYKSRRNSEHESKAALNPAPLSKPLTQSQRQFLSRAVRQALEPLLTKF